jgi:hypothetical protein
MHTSAVRRLKLVGSHRTRRRLMSCQRCASCCKQRRCTINCFAEYMGALALLRFALILAEAVIGVSASVCYVSSAVHTALLSSSSYTRWQQSQVINPLVIALSQPHASLRSEPPRASRTTLTLKQRDWVRSQLYCITPRALRNRARPQVRSTRGTRVLAPDPRSVQHHRCSVRAIKF